MEKNSLHNYKIQSGRKPGISAIACQLCSLPPSDLHPRTLAAPDVCLPHAGYGGHLLTGWLSHDPHGRRGPVPHHHQPPHQRCHSGTELLAIFGTVGLTLLQLCMYCISGNFCTVKGSREKISRSKIFALLAFHENLTRGENIRCHHPRQLLQQIRKRKKPSVLHLVGNVGHTGSILVWLFGPNLASMPALMV